MPVKQYSQTTMKAVSNVSAFLQSEINKAKDNTIFILPELELTLNAPIIVNDKTIGIIGGGGVEGLKTKMWTYHNQPAFTFTRKETGATAILKSLQFGNGLNENNGDDNHCLLIQIPTKAEDILIEGYWGDGIRLNGNAENSTDVSFCRMRNIKIASCKGYGIYIFGADANAGSYYDIDIRDNGLAGIHDASFLGNSWIGCMAHLNGTETWRLSRENWKGNYMATDVNNRASFISCYSEEGSPPSLFKGQAVICGGLHGEDRLVLENYATAQIEGGQYQLGDGRILMAPYDRTQTYVETYLNYYK